jgi:hypothetical protein
MCFMAGFMCSPMSVLCVCFSYECLKPRFRSVLYSAFFLSIYLNIFLSFFLFYFYFFIKKKQKIYIFK